MKIHKTNHKLLCPPRKSILRIKSWKLIQEAIFLNNLTFNKN